jgi:hypothetical protein
VAQEAIVDPPSSLRTSPPRSVVPAARLPSRRSLSAPDPSSRQLRARQQDNARFAPVSETTANLLAFDAYSLWRWFPRNNIAHVRVRFLSSLSSIHDLYHVAGAARARLALALLALGLLNAQCKRSEKSAELGAGSVKAPHGAAPDFQPRYANAGAFDLRNVANGAALVWADAKTGVLWLTRYDDEGAERDTRRLLGSERADASGVEARVAVEEIALAASADEFGVVWIQRSGSDLRTLGTVRPIHGAEGAQAFDLGSVSAPLAAPRGNLAIVLSGEGDFRVMSRGMQSACVRRDESDCISYAFHRLTPRAAARQGMPLSVPRPCGEGTVFLASLRQRWHYGVCSRKTGRLVSTLFTIQPEPAYARADAVLEGCRPAGVFGFEGDLLIVGDCPTERRGIRVSGKTASLSELSLSYLDARCRAGQLLLAQPGSPGLELRFSSRHDQLEAILPKELRSKLGRAVWTGRALLVATVANGALEMRRYRCDSSLLRAVE